MQFENLILKVDSDGPFILHPKWKHFKPSTLILDDLSGKIGQPSALASMVGSVGCYQAMMDYKEKCWNSMTTLSVEDAQRISKQREP